LNYIELINQFWQKDIEFNFVDKEIALYFYLLKVSNSTGWKNPFGLSNSMTIAKFNWGKTSFNNAKNRLKKAGLIDFKGGDGRGNVYQYEIKVLVKGTRGAPLYDTLSDTLSDTLYDQKPATSINIKDKPKQKKDIGLAPPRNKIFKAPELKEVREYFLSTIGNSKNQNAWPSDKCHNEALRLVDHYTANGWVQSRGKKIIDWKAACRNWIRNELTGTFSNTKIAPPQKVIEKPKAEQPAVNRIQVDINYLRDRFIENEENVTTISIYPEYYNFLKQEGLINFNTEHQEQIKKMATAKLNGSATEKELISMMKKIAVIEYFKKLKQNGTTKS